MVTYEIQLAVDRSEDLLQICTDEWLWGRSKAEGRKLAARTFKCLQNRDKWRVRCYPAPRTVIPAKEGVIWFILGDLVF